jgi:hypothetical protein
MNDKAKVLFRITRELLIGNKSKAKEIIKSEYPFIHQDISHRLYLE